MRSDGRIQRKISTVKRLFSTEENTSLNTSILAGFVKSRFWILIDKLKHLKIDTLYNYILYSSFLLFLLCGLTGSFNYVSYVFLLLYPISFCYIVKSNLGILVRVWQHSLGKIVYAVLASVIIGASKVASDQSIRLILHTSPSLFASSQQSLFMYFSIIFTLILVGLGIFIVGFAFMLRDAVASIFTQLLMFLDIFTIPEMLGIASQNLNG